MPYHLPPVDQSSHQSHGAAARTVVLRTTAYEITVGVLATASFVSCLAFCFILGQWIIQRKPAPPTPAVVSMLPSVMLDGDGGWEDGILNASPNVDSPEDPSLDPSLALEATDDVTELMGIAEQITGFSDDAAIIASASAAFSEDGVLSGSAMPNEFTGTRNSGTPGSAEGTGGRPLGRGGPGRGGQKREQRWIIEFAEKGDLDSYAAQLDYFGIELGAKFTDDERLVYLKDLSRQSPVVREVKAAEANKDRRLFMTWVDGSEERRAADLKLFEKAGVDASQAQILHFYTQETELHLAAIEQQYRGATAGQIRQTVFGVRRVTAGFEFFVVSQR